MSGPKYPPCLFPPPSKKSSHPAREVSFNMELRVSTTSQVSPDAHSTYQLSYLSISLSWWAVSGRSSYHHVKPTHLGKSSMSRLSWLSNQPSQTSLFIVLLMF